MTTREQLERARALLVEHGTTALLYEDDQHRRCLIGALHCAATGEDWRSRFGGDRLAVVSGEAYLLCQKAIGGGNPERFLTQRAFPATEEVPPAVLQMIDCAIALAAMQETIDEEVLPDPASHFLALQEARRQTWLTPPNGDRAEPIAITVY